VVAMTFLKFIVVKWDVLNKELKWVDTNSNEKNGMRKEKERKKIKS